MAALWRTRNGRGGMILFGVVVLAALVLPFFLPDYRVQQFPRSEAPTWAHLFGTDELGRDILSRVAQGARISLMVATGAVLVAATIGAGVGMAAGFAGGWIDALLMRLVDAAMAIPRLFVLLLVLAVLDHIPLPLLMVLLGATGWFGTSRLVRAEVLRLRGEGFVAAARALGAGRRRIIFRHLVPNAAGPLIVAATLSVADVLLLEAGLSFLGLGVPIPMPSWGAMIQSGMAFRSTAPWICLFPGLAIVITVLAVNLIGDGLRQSLTPERA
ncbi:MAG TPA: ABC transporter permease [Gemmatimonadales bacterium]|nr:ABC transporter permease [Gemmatimonadales bacterium]